MKKKLQKIKVIGITIIILFISSCQKENLNSSSSITDSSISQENLIDGWISNEKLVFKPRINENKLTPIQVVWALGSAGRIFRSYDQGANWTEPSPSSAAKQISACDGALWGISPDDKIWKWNGTSWYQPNTSASAVYISASSDNEAWVVTSAGNVYATTNGGLSYGTINHGSVGPLQQVSNGGYLNTYGVTNNEQLVRFNYSTNQFESTTTVAEYIDASPFQGELWAIGANNRLFYSLNDAVTWIEPNSSNVVYQMAEYSMTKIYAIGASNRIFKSTNMGVNWTEPNTSARASQITAGVEYQ